MLFLSVFNSASQLAVVAPFVMLFSITKIQANEKAHASGPTKERVAYRSTPHATLQSHVSPRENLN
jgi:hypothetical protein